MKIFSYAALTLIALVILGLLGYYYRLIFPEKIISFQVKTVLLDKAVYQPGDTILFKVPYCKYQDLVGQHIITMEDGTILPVYSDMRELPLGCHNVTYPVTIIAVTPPGKYKLSLRIDYQIRYLFFEGTQEAYSISSNEFTVIPKP